MVRKANWAQSISKNPVLEESVAGKSSPDLRENFSPIFRSVMIAAILTVQITTPLPAFASDQLDAAVKLFESRDYHNAATRFERIVAAQPTNEKARYYLGLAYKAEGKYAAASKQFVWVSLNGYDKTCVDYSRQQVLSMKKPNASLREKGAAAKVVKAPPPAPAAVPAPAPAPVAAAVPAPAKKNLGRCKVIYFENNSPDCLEFAPQFDEARRKYQHKIDFQRMDAENDGASLAEKYGIKSYPRLVYLDGSGKLLYNDARSEFQKRLQELTGP